MKYLFYANFVGLCCIMEYLATGNSVLLAKCYFGLKFMGLILSLLAIIFGHLLFEVTDFRSQLC